MQPSKVALDVVEKHSMGIDGWAAIGEPNVGGRPIVDKVVPKAAGDGLPGPKRRGKTAQPPVPVPRVQSGDEAAGGSAGGGGGGDSGAGHGVNWKETETKLRPQIKKLLDVVEKLNGYKATLTQNEEHAKKDPKFKLWATPFINDLAKSLELTKELEDGVVMSTSAKSCSNSLKLFPEQLTKFFGADRVGEKINALNIDLNSKMKEVAVHASRIANMKRGAELAHDEGTASSKRACRKASGV